MARQMSGIGRFFHGIWKAIDIFCHAIVYFFIILFTISFIIGLSSQESLKVDKGSALYFAPSGSIVEQKDYIDPFDALLQSSHSSEPQQTSIHELLKVLRNAKVDSRIDSMVLNVDAITHIGFANLEDLAEGLQDFKSSGKKIIAHSDGALQKNYYLLAQADEVYVSPVAGFLFEGLAIYPLYQRALLEDKLKINIHVFKAGTYKTFVEPFVRDDMSSEAKEAYSYLINDLWQKLSLNIAESRNISQQELEDYIEKLPELAKSSDGNFAQLAVDKKLADGIKTPQEFNAYMINKLGKKQESYPAVHWSDYLSLLNRSNHLQQKGNIAVITAKGDIVNGSCREGKICSDSLIDLLAQARQDEKVKAVVLRIDSPGGGADASEYIRYEILALKQANKPVVISMSNLAASGGYWISANADEIWARETTITGSIGVFGLVMTLEDSIDAIGLHSDGVATHNFSSFTNPFRPMTPYVKDLFQVFVSSTYNKFLTLVADGRNMSVEAVDKVGQGRVWTGTQALEFGLVDKLGSLQDAIESAAQLANIEKSKIKVKHIEHSKTDLEVFIEQLSQTHLAKTFSHQQQTKVPSLLKRSTYALLEKIESLAHFNDPKGVYAHCMCSLSP